MKLCKLIAVMIFITCFLLTGCDSGDKKRYSWGARNLDQANALFIRIQASYEVIKTGEIVEFDYIMSCYNAEVRGSFRGVEHPSTMYKMTKDRAVLSVTHPNHYCINGGFSKSQSSQKYFGLITHPQNLYRAPILGWYDNVDDLRVGYYYLTNDAYSSPRAKVRFIDYKASKSTREDYKAWVAKTEDEYVQVGALPGPFGCGDSSPTGSCKHKDRVARNHGGRVASSHARVSVRTLRVPEVLDEFPAYMRAYFPADRRAYFCESDDNSATGKPQRWTISHFADKKVKAFIDAHPNQSKSRKERYKDWKYKQVVSLRKKITTMRKGKIRLDPDALKGKGEPELPIEEVYPMVYFKHPRRGSEKGAYGFLLQILYDPTWRGFEIVGPYAPSPASVPKYGGRFHTVLFVNDDMACELNAHAQPDKRTLFDSKRGLIFNTNGSKG